MLGAQVGVAVEPAPRKVEAVLLVRLGQPAVHPQVQGAEVDAGQRVVAQEVAAVPQCVVRVVRQQVCMVQDGQGAVLAKAQWLVEATVRAGARQTLLRAR